MICPIIFDKKTHPHILFLHNYILNKQVWLL